METSRASLTPLPLSRYLFRRHAQASKGLPLIGFIDAIQSSRQPIYRCWPELHLIPEPAVHPGNTTVLYNSRPGSYICQYPDPRENLVPVFAAPVLSAIKSRTAMDNSVPGVTGGHAALSMSENEARWPSQGLFTGFPVGFLGFWRSLRTPFVLPDSTGWNAVSGARDTGGYAKYPAKSAARTQMCGFVAIRVYEDIVRLGYRRKRRGS
jgi:hypothetical protein